MWEILRNKRGKKNSESREITTEATNKTATITRLTGTLISYKVISNKNQSNKQDRKLCSFITQMHALIGSRSPVNEILYEIQGSLLPEKVAFFADGSYRVFGWTVIYFVVNRRE